MGLVVGTLGGTITARGTGNPMRKGAPCRSLPWTTPNSGTRRRRPLVGACCARLPGSPSAPPAAAHSPRTARGTGRATAAAPAARSAGTTCTPPPPRTEVPVAPTATGTLSAPPAAAPRQRTARGTGRASGPAAAARSAGTTCTPPPLRTVGPLAPTATGTRIALSLGAPSP